MSNQFDEWMLQNIPTILGTLVIIVTLLSLFSPYLSGILQVSSIVSSIMGKALDIIYKIPGINYLVDR